MFNISTKLYYKRYCCNMYKKIIIAVLCLCMAASILSGCNILTNEGLVVVDSFNEISVNPFKAMTISDEYFEYDQTRLFLIDEIVEVSSYVSVNVKKLDKVLIKERKRLNRLLMQFINLNDSDSPVLWLLGEWQRITRTAEAINAEKPPKDAESYDKNLINCTNTIKTADLLISEVVFIEAVYTVLEEYYNENGTSKDKLTILNAYSKWNEFYEGKAGKISIEIITDKMVIEEMLGTLLEADRIVALSEMSVLVAQLDNTYNLIEELRYSNRYSDEDIEMLEGVWGFYYVNTTGLLLNLTTSETVLETSITLAGSDRYLLSNIGGPYTPFSVDDAVSFMKKVKNIRNTSAYNSIKNTAVVFLDKYKAKLKEEALTLASNVRTLQRGVTGFIGAAGKMVELTVIVGDAVYNKVFGDGKNYDNLYDTLDAFTKDTKKEIDKGRLGVDTMKTAVKYFDTGTKKAGEAVGWLAVKASGGNKLAGSAAAYLTRLIGGGLTGLGRAVVKLADPTSTAEDMYDSAVTLIMLALGGKTVIKGVTDISNAVLGSNARGVFTNFIKKWMQDSGKAVIRQIDGKDPNKFDGEWDEKAINKGIDLMRRLAEGEEPSKLFKEGKESLLSSIIDILQISDKEKAELKKIVEEKIREAKEADEEDDRQTEKPDEKDDKATPKPDDTDDKATPPPDTKKDDEKDNNATDYSGIYMLSLDKIEDKWTVKPFDPDSLYVSIIPDYDETDWEEDAKKEYENRMNDPYEESRNTPEGKVTIIHNTEKNMLTMEYYSWVTHVFMGDGTRQYTFAISSDIFEFSGFAYYGKEKKTTNNTDGYLIFNKDANGTVIITGEVTVDSNTGFNRRKRIFTIKGSAYRQSSVDDE